jgi:ABC-type glycerol-3-phosphate transport system substrate-binding protein
MKKLLLLMAACFVMVACGSEEKKAEKQPETLVEFAQEAVKAAEAKDAVKFVDLYEANAKLVAELAKDENKEKKAEQEKAMKKWIEKNPDAGKKMNEFARSKEVQEELAKRAKAEEKKEE